MSAGLTLCIRFARAIFNSDADILSYVVAPWSSAAETLSSAAEILRVSAGILHSAGEPSSLVLLVSYYDSCVLVLRSRVLVLRFCVLVLRC